MREKIFTFCGLFFVLTNYLHLSTLKSLYAHFLCTVVRVLTHYENEKSHFPILDATKRQKWI